MKTLGRLALAALVLLPASLHDASAEDAAACATPGKLLQPIMPTHSLPPYPPPSVRGHEQGRTLMAVQIGIDGVPAEVSVTQSSGTQRLDDAAVQHIKSHWRWQPPTEDCKSVTAEMAVSVGWHVGTPPKAKAGLEMRPSYYPPGAAERMEAGDAYLELSIGDGGAVESGRVVYSSGFSDLDDKALDVPKNSSGALAGQPAGTAIVLIRWSLPPEQRKSLESVTIFGSVIRF
jgi:TonB family protein